MTFKAHACCGHTFAAIDGALELRDTVAAEDVERIVISTYGTAIQVAGNSAPATRFEAQFSIQYCVAAALLLGSVWLEAFSDVHLHDARLRDLLGRVELVLDPELDGAFPDQRGARVAIHHRDGSVSDTLRRTRKGDPDAPLSDDDLTSKLTNLASPILGREATQRLASSIWNLEEMEDVHLLVPTKTLVVT
jgi:2-methylcitrate dehydratase PrpD